jgi:hypothetical protein
VLHSTNGELCRVTQALCINQDDDDDDDDAQG